MVANCTVIYKTKALIELQYNIAWINHSVFERSPIVGHLKFSIFNRVDNVMDISK